MAISAKQKNLLKHLTDNFFVISVACKKAKIDRTTYYEWLKQEEFKNKVAECELDYLNLVEDQLKTSSLNNEAWAVKFTLERKHPEYKQKAQIEVNKPSFLFDGEET